MLSLIVLDAVERVGIEPSFCAGHSLGEYTALTATGALGFDDGVRLVIERAAAMHEAGQASPGTMAAVLGLDDDQVEVACRLADSDVWVANFNAPGQVVIAGSPEGVDAAADVAKELGAKKVMPLPVVGRVPHAVHDPGPRSAAQGDRRGRAARHRRCRWCPTSTPRPTTSAPSGPRCCPLSSPARCAGSRCCRRWTTAHVSDIAELGPGGVLTGMAKRTLDTVRTISVSAPEDIDKLLEWIAGGSSTVHVQLEGEHLFATERVVVSPAAGVFTPVDAIDPGATIAVGDVLGSVNDVEVRSPFAGVLQSYIAVQGERVTLRQPIAWLRTA